MPALPPVLLWLARLALASPFLFSGITKALDFAGATGEVRALTGLEPAGVFAAAVIAVQLGGSALLLARGRAVWLGAALLAGFTLAATLVAHDFWNKPAGTALRDATTFLEHVGLIAGLALAAYLSGGRRP
ncbi:DoxX family protein [Erythrobacter sp. NE805]|uniref:DoxX family protein n=1 Tax=Erythrobacter sp. NE805 TaxID=3389875 RepID=UPI00396B35C2